MRKLGRTWNNQTNGSLVPAISERSGHSRVISCGTSAPPGTDNTNSICFGKLVIKILISVIYPLPIWVFAPFFHQHVQHFSKDKRSHKPSWSDDARKWQKIKSREDSRSVFYLAAMCLQCVTHPKLTRYRAMTSEVSQSQNSLPIWRRRVCSVLFFIIYFIQYSFVQ